MTKIYKIIIGGLNIVDVDVVVVVVDIIHVLPWGGSFHLNSLVFQLIKLVLQNILDNLFGIERHESEPSRPVGLFVVDDHYVCDVAKTLEEAPEFFMCDIPW
ncbi:hypothetical protein TIFTF001_004588 [Ficus carica]|uniref:Uncharacterized protein n=1 Tax=Ficus carica TaxID=3494 RepID=A0AA88A513_FICCA|nr:hypothetical protein TIFTF001_004588 [Ficus carica]